MPSGTLDSTATASRAATMRKPERSRVRSARHQKGTTRTGTGPHGMAQDDTATSGNGPCGYGCSAGVRIDTVEVSGSLGRW